jgi:hypothetical protein
MLMSIKPANKRFLIVMSIIVALLLGWWAWSYFGPKPLGDRLEYIGRTDSGYIPFISDSKFSASYYYATTMNPKEILSYFKKSNPDDISDLKDNENPDLATFSLRSPGVNNPIYITYYANGAQHTQNLNLPHTTKHLILIHDEDYNAAKASIQL